MRLQGAGPAHPDSYRCNREIWRLSWFCMVAYIIALMWCSVVFYLPLPTSLLMCIILVRPNIHTPTIYPLHLVSYPIISILFLLYLVVLSSIHLLTPSAFVPAISWVLWIYTYPISMGIYGLSTISCSTLIYPGTISRPLPGHRGISCIFLILWVLYLVSPVQPRSS